MLRTFNAHNGTLDRFGVAASCLCAAHCALTPFVVSLLPLVGLGMLADERAEWAFIALTVAVGLMSLLISYFRRHGRAGALMLFAAGVCLIFTVRVLFEEGVKLETPAVVAGALLIAASHVVNLKLCRACSSCAS